MKLMFNVDQLYIEDITEQAMSYIESERSKLIEPYHQHWCFARKCFYRNGKACMGITAYPKEDKTELVSHIEALIANYGLAVSDSAEPIYSLWLEEAKVFREIEALWQRISALRDRAEEEAIARRKAINHAWRDEHLFEEKKYEIALRRKWL